ncbi:hypothetical protein QQ045_026653 [Rhodiola kirilowii]
MRSPAREGGIGSKGGLVGVCIDKDKGSQHAMKWAVENLLQKGQTVILLHVKIKSSNSVPSLPRGINGRNENGGKQIDQQTKELFLPFRCFCTRKDIQCRDVTLEDPDIAKAIAEYVGLAAIEHLVVGASSRYGLFRFKEKDTPGAISRATPDFCNVYVISKGKVQSTRSACRSAPTVPMIQHQITNQTVSRSDPTGRMLPTKTPARDRPTLEPRLSVDDELTFRSPFTRQGYDAKSYTAPDSDISFVSTGRPSVDRLFPSLYESNDGGGRSPGPRFSNASDLDLRGFESSRRSLDVNSLQDFSSFSQDIDRLSTSSNGMDDIEAEMRRLKMELKQTMDMYSSACKEALTAKQKAQELQRWKLDEERRLEEARLAEEAAMAIVQREKAKSRAALEHAEAAQRIAEMEAQKRINAEMRALKEAEEKRKVLDALSQSDVRYRKYTIDEIEAATERFSESRKIGEGGYGPVYKCTLDHTPVAIKVLRPDAAQGRTQFQQEVEILSCIRHPNMVLLLGACPEYGCLVYEYMANGSLDDRLFCRGNTPPLSWQARFRIAAEIGTGLLFVHQTKPEPLVHRDLKPGNILLDRNFVSKISDVGLARLVPPSVADSVTQYRMTSTAGTFCYIDPEYQQTGMLGIKSDVYSLGIMLLQIITCKPPMGLSHHISRAIEKGTFAEMLDPAVPDWPVEETLSFAKMALKCAELRRKDRPDLGSEILPELNRMRTLGEESLQQLSGPEDVQS